MPDHDPHILEAYLTVELHRQVNWESIQDVEPSEATVYRAMAAYAEYFLRVSTEIDIILE